jgi:hypothetical protein
MNKNDLSFPKENKSSINEYKYKDSNLRKLKICTKLILLLSLFIIYIFTLNKNYKIIRLNNFIKVKENKRPNNNDFCDNLDPIRLFKLRLENGPITICQNEKSKHICYKNNNSYYNKIFFEKDGVICKMKNIVIDPSKSKHTKIIYKGPVDRINRVLYYQKVF